MRVIRTLHCGHDSTNLIPNMKKLFCKNCCIVLPFLFLFEPESLLVIRLDQMYLQEQTNKKRTKQPCQAVGLERYRKQTTSIFITCQYLLYLLSLPKMWQLTLILDDFNIINCFSILLVFTENFLSQKVHSLVS